MTSGTRYRDRLEWLLGMCKDTGGVSEDQNDDYHLIGMPKF